MDDVKLPRRRDYLLSKWFVSSEPMDAGDHGIWFCGLLLAFFCLLSLAAGDCCLFDDVVAGQRTDPK